MSNGLVTAALATVFWTVAAPQVAAQNGIERTPNTQGVWELTRWQGAFILSHRFESLEGGDELISIPTLTLALGVPLGITAGADFTSFSEVVPKAFTGNETQIWIKRGLSIGPVRTAAIGAYNTAANSWDGALDARVAMGRISLFAEGRGFSNLFGMEEAGAAGAVGAAFRIGEYIAVSGDVGKVLSEEGIPAAWSGALVLEIPASPHTLSLVLTNTGATTLQGASREKVVGDAAVRYGFLFTVPLGGRGRWGRIFDPLGGA